MKNTSVIQPGALRLLVSKNENAKCNCEVCMCENCTCNTTNTGGCGCGGSCGKA